MPSERLSYGTSVPSVPGKWCDNVDVDGDACEKPRDLAKRIDAEYVKLPKDTGGKYIHEHDKVDWLDHAGTWHENATVVAVCDDGCYVMDGTVFHVHKSNIRHHHEPTVEDVLREFADEMNQNLGMYTGEAIDADEWRDADAKTVEKFAAKLRLAGDGEEEW